MYLVKKEENQMWDLPCKELSPRQFKSISSELAQKIIKKLAEKQFYPKELSKALNVHEQKVYYHIKNLEKEGLIRRAKSEAKQGAIAYYYELSSPCFAATFKDFKISRKITAYTNESEYLEPFIENGELKSLIIVGSPDPHGPEKARSRDGYYGMDLALFLGTFLNHTSSLKVRLDTEITNDELRNNLIILGGPIVNNITSKINSKIPIKFVGKKIFSMLSNKEYFSDECGVILKAANPFDKTKKILLVAGKRQSGTRSCIIAFIKHFKELTEGNKHNSKIHAKVIEGIDLDSDGVVDDVEIKE